MTVPNARLLAGRELGVFSGSETGLVPAGSSGWLRGDATWQALSGTAFPSSPAPVAGQQFYRTDHRTLYAYDAAAVEWLSVQIFEFPFGHSTTTAATAYLKFNEQAGFIVFSDTMGWIIAARCRVVGMALVMGSSGTATVQAFSSGSAVAGSELVLSTQIAKADEALLSDPITASTALAVKVTSGTVNAPARGIVRLRRAETP